MDTITYKVIYENKSGTITGPYLEPYSDKYIIDKADCLFVNDTIVFDSNSNGNQIPRVVKSIYRGEDITGILVLEGNTTYGRKLLANGKPGKLYYGVITSNPLLPNFKVPYEIKHNGNSRYSVNKYVRIRFVDWKKGERPEGIITETFGDVTNLLAFQNYELARYHLSRSPSFKSLVKPYRDFDREQALTKLTNLFGKEPVEVFTIDPEGCVDMDDAIGIYETDEHIDVFVCITNVPLWLDLICDADYDIAGELHNTTSLYLDENTIHMLPKPIMECMTLKTGLGLALCLHLVLDKEMNIISYNFENCVINCVANYAYESKELLSNNKYIRLRELTFTLNKTKTLLSNVNDSHDVVAYLMVMMNTLSARELAKQKMGIFRGCNLKHTGELPHELSHLKSKLIYSSGVYTNYQERFEHAGFGADVYCHVTSPMRRAVDIVNMHIINNTLLSSNVSYVSKNIIDVLNEHIMNSLNVINKQYKDARKLSLDISFMCLMSMKRDEICNRFYDALIIERNDKELLVYISEFDRFFRVKCDMYSTNDMSNINNSSTHTRVKLHVYENEYHLRKKFVFTIDN